MKNYSTFVRQICILTAVIMLIGTLSALPALADAGAANATQGDASRSVIFLVNSKGSSSITLKQTTNGQMLQTSNWDGSQRYRTLPGMYHVYYNGGNDSGSVEMTTDTAVISFRYAGSYTVTVQPYTLEEINQVLSEQRSATDWLYTCQSWSVLPAWTVQSANNCTCQAAGYNPVVPVATATPNRNAVPVPGIRDYNYPTSYTRGNSFSLRGTVYTNVGQITRITADIYDSAGARIRTANVYPYSTSYALENSSSFSSSLRFEQLESGSYTYKLTVTAVNGSQSSTTVLVTCGFRVNAPAATATPNVPVLSISGANTPASIIMGTAFVPKGTITCSSGTITEVKGEILNSNGYVVLTVSRYPYRNSYTLENDSTFNNAMKFSQLSTGRYTYRVTATAQNGSRTETTVLVQSGFFVYAAATATPTPAVQTPVLTIKGENAPDNLASGTAFVPAGTITASCGQITRVTGEILSASGSIIMTVNRYPYKDSYSLNGDSTFNNAMKFSQLSAGNYVYRVTATAQNQGKTATTVLVQRSFRVYDAATPTPTAAARTPQLSISAQNYPSSFAQGTVFSPAGIILTDCGQITRVTVEVLNSSGVQMMSVIRYPYKSSFDLSSDSNIRNGLHFEQLSPGSYIYRVSVNAQYLTQTVTNTLINAGFYVYAAATATPDTRVPVLSISYPSYPTSYTEGTAFYPRGTVYTDCGKITRITGEILSSNGSVLMSVNRYPDQASYQLDNDSTFNNSMRFSRLTPGNYVYRVTATAQQGSKTATTTLINVSFQVIANATPVVKPTLSISNENIPSAYTEGSTFHPHGLIRTSSGTITKVTGEILDGAGRLMMSVDRYPNQSSYDLNNDSTFNYAMKFSQLPPGNYTYRVKAWAENGSESTSSTLINCTFLVYSNVTPVPVTPTPKPLIELAITDYNAPGTLYLGSTCDLKGTIHSDLGDVTEVSVEILNSSLQSVRRVVIPSYGNTVRLEDRRSELSELHFDTLEEGSYTYLVNAQAMINGQPVDKNLVNKGFSVTVKVVPTRNPLSPVEPVGEYSMIPSVEIDTQFREGKCKNNDNKDRVLKLPNLIDNDPSTNFLWLFYNSESKDDVAEFTYTFANETLNAIGLHNGNAASSNKYNGNARPTRLRLEIRCADGTLYTENIKLRDSFSADWKVYDLNRTYTDVESVDIFVTEICLGDSNAYSVYISDMQFFAK